MKLSIQDLLVQDRLENMRELIERQQLIFIGQESILLTL